MENKDKKKDEEEYEFGTSEEEDAGLLNLVKKLVTAGIGAAFMTEEGIRSYLGQIKLPKEVLHLILQGAGRSKEELLDRIANEISRILKKIDVVEEASKFVETHRFKVSAEIEVIRKDS